MKNNGEAPVERACAAAEEPGTILHTLYQQCLSTAEFFVEYFAVDLIMGDDGACRGVVAWNSRWNCSPVPGANDRASNRRIWSELLFPVLLPTHAGDGNGW